MLSLYSRVLRWLEDHHKSSRNVTPASEQLNGPIYLHARASTRYKTWNLSGNFAGEWLSRSSPLTTGLWSLLHLGWWHLLKFRYKNSFTYINPTLASSDDFFFLIKFVLMILGRSFSNGGHCPFIRSFPWSGSSTGSITNGKWNKFCNFFSTCFCSYTLHNSSKEVRLECTLLDDMFCCLQ